ncbi:MAG: hypothetical protein WBP45_00750 [Daejeonella sp.]
MKKVLTSIIFISILFLSACTNNPKVETVNNVPDSSKTVIEAAEPTQLKDVIINEKYFNTQSVKSRKLSPDVFGSLGLESILSKEELKDASLTFKVLDTLFISKVNKIMILSCETENEHRAWLMAYENNKPVTTAQVYYQDFVEYLSKTSTLIKDNKIIITTQTDEEGNETDKTEKYRFTNRQQLELVK